LTEDKDNKNNEVLEWIKSIGAAIVISIFITTFIFNSTYVAGDSMNPTLYNKDRLFAIKLPLYFKGPSAGDIVVLEAPDKEGKENNKDYIKRVIGLEGDKIQIIDGKVYVNDKLLKEDYIDKDAYTNTYYINTWVIPEGEVFVLGDNREEGASKDSRFFGPVPIKSLKGITGFRYFPINKRFGRLK